MCVREVVKGAAVLVLLVLFGRLRLGDFGLFRHAFAFSWEAKQA
jgi:hypothetical protein